MVTIGLHQDGIQNRHGANSIPELKLMVNSNSNFGIDYFNKMILELINLELELKFSAKPN